MGDPKKFLAWVFAFSIALLVGLGFVLVVIDLYSGSFPRLTALTSVSSPLAQGLVIAGAAAAVATVLVIILAATRGTLEFSALGVNFKGPSGPLLLWTVVFLAVAGVILGVLSASAPKEVREENRLPDSTQPLGAAEAKAASPPTEPLPRRALLGWGGAYDPSGSKCNTSNPLTGSCSCPKGYEMLDLSEAGVHFCYIGTGPGLLSWGGAYDPSGSNCNTPNPFTGSCACPTGYETLDLSEAGVQLCYNQNSTGGWEWGGAYDPSGDSCNTENPVTGSCSCPEDFKVLDLSEAGIQLCYREQQDAV